MPIKATDREDGSVFLDTQFSLRDGERFVCLLDKAIPLVIDEYAADPTTRADAHLVEAEQARIWALPEARRHAAFLALSPILASFARHTEKYPALEMVYSHGDIRFDGLDGCDDGGTARRWFDGFENARAVRERGTITTRLLVESILERARRNQGSPVEVVSIASGSARCVLDAVRQARALGIQVHARMFDLDGDALTYSRKLAAGMQLKGMIETIQGNVVRDISTKLGHVPADVVEAVGIMDYLPDPVVLRYFLPQLYDLLKDGGRLIASNIKENREQSFLHDVIGWKDMIYRTSETFANLFVRPRVGFQPKNCRAHLTPDELYCLVEAQKATRPQAVI